MARLNESAAPGESLETLKRRFVRQNREIARVNSIQSLRIRSLESEVSHLLSENVSLREQVITLGQELERFEAAKLLSDGVHGVRTKLEIKLAELSTLVSDLGTLPRKFNKSLDQNREVPQKRLDQDRLDLKTQAPDGTPNLDTEDGRLPVILEDKHYPRKTLEFNEICALENDEDVANWAGIDGDADNVVPSPKQEKLSLELHENEADVSVQRDSCEADEALLPATLETRRKKRSSASFSKKAGSIDCDESGTLKGAECSPRPGAKRKFSSDDDHDGRESITTEDDDFQFTRPNHSSQAAQETSIFIGDPTPVERPAHFKETQNPKGLKRKALGPKSTNTRISSPEDTRKAISPKHRKNILAATDFQHDQSRGFSSSPAKERPLRKQKTISDNSASDNGEKAVQGDVAAGTIGPEEVLTQFDQPDTTTNNHIDPPPRPTRRQRAVVSYAEPNLRDKMRRPTNEFIAAVANDQARRKSSSVSSRANPDDEPSGQMSACKDSANFQALDSMIRESEHPKIESSGSCPRQAMAMVSQRKRKALSEKNENMSILNHVENPKGTAFSHPMLSDFKALEASKNCPIASGNGPEHVEGTFTSNACEGDYSPATVDIRRTTPALNRKSRRHSSNPMATSRGIGLSSIDSQYIPTTDCLGDSATSALHERSIQSNEQKTNTDGDIYTESSVSLLVGQTQAKRGQRAAARRRSMML